MDNPNPCFCKCRLYPDTLIILSTFFFQGQKLKFIEEEVLEQLVEQIKLHSESLILDLERATAELKTEPEDLRDLSKYALMV